MQWLLPLGECQVDGETLEALSALVGLHGSSLHLGIDFRLHVKSAKTTSEEAQEALSLQAAPSGQLNLPAAVFRDCDGSLGAK